MSLTTKNGKGWGRKQGQCLAVCHSPLHTEGVVGSNPASPTSFGLKYTNPQKVNEMAPKLTTWLTSDEYAEREGISRVAAVKRLKSGKVPGAEQVTTGKRLVWRIPATYKGDCMPWDAIEVGWIKTASTGLLTGRPIGAKTLKNMEYGMGWFWSALGVAPSVDAITPDKLYEAYSRYPLDTEGGNCHYGKKEQIYKAVKSLYRYLVYIGQAPPNLAFPHPERIMPAKRKFTDERGFQKLLIANKDHHARKPRDIASTRVILYLAGLCGLRCQEICSLKITDVDTERQEITIALGKGYKRRRVGMPTELKEAITKWMAYHPGGPWLLASSTGQQIDRHCIGRKIRWVSKKAGVDINPHGLRRTAAKIWLDRGYSITKVQNMLGHSDITTTQMYALEKEEDVIAMMVGK